MKKPDQMAEPEDMIRFHDVGDCPREYLRFVPRGDSFDIIIGDGITPTEAALKFIELVRQLMPK